MPAAAAGSKARALPLSGSVLRWALATGLGGPGADVPPLPAASWVTVARLASGLRAGPAGLLSSAGLPVASAGPLERPKTTAAPPARPPEGELPKPPDAAHPDNARPPTPFPPLPDLYGTRPIVAVYHTDSREAYGPALLRAGQTADVPFTSDQGLSVVQVGAVLCRDLAALHLFCAHSRAVNDPDGMLGAYANSLKTARALMTTFPTLRVLLDVHRAATGSSGGPANGSRPAALTIVVGTDDRLPDPHWRSNLAFARRLAAAALRLSPAWTVKVRISENQLNQEVATGALLLEIGNTQSSLEAADRAAGLIARALADLAQARLLPPSAATTR